MSDESERRRADVEDALAVIARARLLLRTQVVLRVRQAVDRDARFAALLQPAFGHLDEIDQALERAQAIFGADWRSGEQAGWRWGKSVQ